ncbi:MAG: branched-chain amino acid ABC transporter permease [Hyphomicrobiales bacterium]|nr:branched-chain amino acid ABC transporter permease [Hyphomicrobiales bacterium]
MRRQIPAIAGSLALGFLAAFPLVYGAADYDYIMHLWITAFFYAILASSWALLAGYAGQFSFGHMAFMALGAYTTGLFNNYFYLTSAATGTCFEIPFGSWYFVVLDPIGISATPFSCLDAAREAWAGNVVVKKPSLWFGILFGILVGGLFGWLIGRLVLRLRAAYLALFTLGFSEILRSVLSAELNITRGQAGLELDPLFPNGITIFGAVFDATDKLPTYYVMFALFLACIAIMLALERSRFGLFVRSLREDEDAAAALGVHTVRYKVLVFVVTSMIAAAAGAVQAHYIGIITPNILIILQMALVVAMAVVGGLESIIAAAVGAMVLYFLLEFLRNSFTIGDVTVDMTTWRLVFFGALVMLTLRFQRNGLLYPLIESCTRSGVAEETVAKRVAGASASEDAEAAK